MPTLRVISLILALIFPFHANSEEFVVCKSGDFRFGFAPIPKNEAGDIILSLWMKGEEKKFSLGETIQNTEAGDISAEFPPRNHQNKNMKGSILVLSYTVSLSSATLITKEFGRETGEVVIGACRAEIIERS